MRTLAKYLLVVAVLASGCGEGVQPEQRELVYFTAIETDDIAPKPIEDPGVNLTKAQISGSEQIINGFLENHKRLLQQKEVSSRIEQIENIFLALGRYHELMVIYRDDWEARGTDSYVADRFAWGLIRLGQRKRSREVITKLLVAQPDESRNHFLDGAAYLQEQPPNPEHFAAIVAAWKRVLELDPNFVGYEGLNAATLRQEIANFEARIPADAAEKPTAPAEEPAVEPPVEPAPPEESPSTPGEPVVEEPVAEQPVAEQPVAEAPAPPAPAHAKDELYLLAVAKGQIALSQSNYSAAEAAFLEARTIKPNAFDAEFGHLQAGWGNVAARSKVAGGMRELAKRDDLTASQRLELGVFLWTKMGRKDLAIKQLEAAKAADVSMGPKIDGLLIQMK